MNHGHSHSHSHGGPSQGTSINRMLTGIGILVVFLVIEIAVGYLSHSLALLADAGHMATDVFALVIGSTAVAMARYGKAGSARTFGWHRAEVLTAVVNAALLLGVSVFIAVEAYQRLTHPQPVAAWPVLITAVVGLTANVVVMIMLRDDSHESIAVKGAYMEVLADAVSSVGVIVAAITMMITGWKYVDAIVAILIVLWIIPRALTLAGQALRILVQHAPRGVDVTQIETDLMAIDGVESVHDLHIWTLTMGMDVATVHIGSDRNDLLPHIQKVLAHHGLTHVTVQIEPVANLEECVHHITW